MYKGAHRFNFNHRLFHVSSKSLENLPQVSNQQPWNHIVATHLQLNLRLSNVLLASAAVGNLGGLGNLVLDSIGAEVLQSVTLGGVDAHGRVGLDSRESTGNYSPRQHTCVPT